MSHLEFLFKKARLSELNSIALVAFLFTSCGIQAKPIDNYYNVIPLSENTSDNHWADYLYSHMQNRSELKGLVVKNLKESEPGEKRVSVHIDAQMKEDCSIHYDHDDTFLSACDDEHMLWLIYQYIDMCGKEDKRLDVSDLPPSMFELGVDTTLTMAFDYRSIYSASNRDEDLFGILGAGNIDFDWAIWGHNFGRMLENANSDEIYALVNDVRMKGQYCFSSKATKDAVTAWIDDNYGRHGKKGQTVRFAIMPQDNNDVCLCPSCRALGNTANSATGAVTALVKMLAEKYPDYEFFTSCYLTTRSVPSRRMPPNTGVLLSAIDLPLKYNSINTPASDKFHELIKSWKNVTKTVYVWDYSRNFDNYLSTFPVISIIQERLQMYRSFGVNGVIFNDSGESHTSFGDLQTYMKACLMISPDMNMEKGIERFLKKNYPVSADILSRYYLTLEQRVREYNKPLQMYGSINDAVNAYIRPTEFKQFFHELDSVSKHIKGKERHKLNRLLTGMTFTMTEMARARYIYLTNEEKNMYLDILNGHRTFPDMKFYREDGFTLDQYISYLRNNPTEVSTEENLLHGNFPKCYALDEDAAKRLTDGLLGIPMDWNVAWSIANVNGMLSLKFPAINEENITFTLGILNMSRWKLGLPTRIELWQGDKMCGRAEYKNTGVKECTRNEMSVSTLKAREGVPIEMRIYTSSRKLAIDEIVVKKK